VSSPMRIAEIAADLGDAGRTAMLCALLDGRALTARELAEVAGVTPQTASGHLRRLTEAGLLAVTSQGRHRYYRLASAEVAGLLEDLMRYAGGRARPRTGPRDPALRAIRSCYDHLAGRLAVGVADRLLQEGFVELSEEGGLVTDRGHAFLAGIGISLDPVGRSGRPLCRPCLDWSERRPHLAGRLGAGLLAFYRREGWLGPAERPRLFRLTRAGERGFARVFGLDALACVDARTERKPPPAGPQAPAGAATS